MKKQFTLLSLIGIPFLLLTSCHLRTHSSEPKTFTITWKNEDGLVLEVDQNVGEGTLPTFDGNTPTKPNDAEYNYTFSGWSPEVSEAHADMTYFATYQQELRKYTVVWKDENGTVLETDTDVPYGTTPEFNSALPTKEATAQYNYSFKGWSPEVNEITGDTTYIATYQEELRKYTITWKDDSGNTLKTEEVAYGEVPSFGENDPTKESTNTHTYTFNGWSPNVVAVDGDATYNATFLEQTRTYTITWVNYDGSILEVDTGLEYGATPSFDGETPEREGIRGADFSFKKWEPEVNIVTKDQVYTATYDATGYFSFDVINYELEEGYTLNDLQGAPWINANLEGELDKIKKPSLKDDFYTYVNYDDIKNGRSGPFELGSVYVKDALTAIYENSQPTTNGDFVKAVIDKTQVGDAANISQYFNNLDVNTYLSSTDIFNSPSSYLQLNYLGETGYEVEFNDGYLDGSLGLQTLWFYSQFNGYSFFEECAQSIVETIGDVLDVEFTSSDIDDIQTLDRALSYQAYYDNYYLGDGFTSYIINELPWSQMKNALLSLGLQSNDTINVKEYYVNSLNYLFNDYAINETSTVEKDIIARVAFDYRFLLGADNYRLLSPYIDRAYIFSSETGLGNLDSERLARQLTKLVVPAAFEQSYIELEGDEETKEEVTNLIKDILDGYKELVNDITWLGRTSRRRVIKKLEKMSFASCYSDYYKNFAKIDDSSLESASLLDLYNRYTSTAINQSINHILMDEFSWAWDTMPSYTVNAFYTVSYNSFIILNGLVQGLIRDDIEELYGMLGFVVGHEITHAFDSSGSYFDENGEYNDLMSGSDRSAFNEKVDNLIAFYDNINLFDDVNVDGERINGEAIADMGGIKVMLQLAKKIPNFDYDRFFKAAAKTWCERPYDEYYIQSMLEDSHPFAYLRANVTLAQFDEFIETYDIGPGDGMYIPENQRVKIW